MTKSKLISQSLLSSLGVWVYTGLVAWLLINGGKVFGPAKSFLVPLSVLLLFVFSATVVGLLVLGRPVIMYLNNSKKEAISLLLYTLGWLLLFTLITFTVLYFTSITYIE